MKVYVVDANVVFAALISGKPAYVSFFDRNQALSIDFLFVDLEKYKKTILKKQN